MQLLKITKSHRLLGLRLFSHRSLLLVALLGLISACALPWRHQASHAGFSAQIRSDWVDSPGGPDVLNVWSKWGGISVAVQKLPGDWERFLDLERSLLGKMGTEEKLTEWFQFKGHGSRFRTYDRNGEIQRELVIFFPEGAFSGYFINASKDSAQSDAREQYEQVIKSLRRQ